MDDKLIYIPSDDKQNYPFCRFELLVETFGQDYFKTNQSKFNKSTQISEPNVGSSVFYSPISPPFLVT